MASCVPLSSGLRARLDEAKRTGWLSLSCLGLRAIPPPVFELGPAVRRLELNDNMIEAIPDGIGKLVNLQDLWLQDNPLRAVSREISRCNRLRTVDLSRTELAALPSEISRLPSLTDLALDGTTLGPSLQEAAEHGAAALVGRLAEEDIRA